MKILWFSWKDKRHPLAGGAEVVTDAILSRLVKDGHEATLLTSGYAGASGEDMVNGYRVIRVGGRASVYWHAFRYYRVHLKGVHDLVVEEINTIPFFTPWYVQGKRALFFHQLAREIWFYQIFFPLSLAGYCIEPFYLRLLSKERVITISESTKRDLARYGFKKENISIISEGIDIKPVERLESIKKTAIPTVLSLGAVRPMKRTLDIVRGFEIIKAHTPEVKLVIAGDMAGKYGKKVLREIANSNYKDDIEVLGKVSRQEKIRLMQEAHVLAVASLKEGWGLVVTEANSQGTPAVVYDVDGLRDCVRDGVTGLHTKENTPQALAEAIMKMLEEKEAHETMRQNAWEWSKTITFEKQYQNFLEIIKK
ncbi:MAG: glycosyltransferase family 4 protein [bacterium]|nr:glycosyltransferase family 4 protein [bacterium]